MNYDHWRFFWLFFPVSCDALHARLSAFMALFLSLQFPESDEGIDFIFSEEIAFFSLGEEAIIIYASMRS